VATNVSRELVPAEGLLSGCLEDWNRPHNLVRQGSLALYGEACLGPAPNSSKFIPEIPSHRRPYRQRGRSSGLSCRTPAR